MLSDLPAIATAATDELEKSTRETMQVLYRLANRDLSLIDNRDWQNELMRLNAILKTIKSNQRNERIKTVAESEIVGK